MAKDTVEFQDGQSGPGTNPGDWNLTQGLSKVSLFVSTA